MWEFIETNHPNYNWTFEEWSFDGSYISREAYSALKKSPNHGEYKTLKESKWYIGDKIERNVAFYTAQFAEAGFVFSYQRQKAADIHKFTIIKVTSL